MECGVQVRGVGCAVRCGEVLCTCVCRGVCMFIEREGRAIEGLVEVLELAVWP